MHANVGRSSIRAIDLGGVAKARIRVAAGWTAFPVSLALPACDDSIGAAACLMSLIIGAQIFMSPSPEVACMGGFGFVNLALALSILLMLLVLMRLVLPKVMTARVYLLATLYAFSAMAVTASRRWVCPASGSGAAQCC
ncbi:MAG: hypothetical protein GAK35_01083 [Herbaspirillum frisingense]|uniref:Uncharacterized protein n=1 Tax=Herbaspirillum frisingense TaxID=92645 RepID=A0A7V8FYS7_9BURK|nr:MAG: hypothetical protein GAK35_01083 [Herbaspirillum frisingense]